MGKLIDADTFANHFCEGCEQISCGGCYENNHMKCKTRRMLEMALEDEDEIEVEESNPADWI